VRRPQCAATTPALPRTYPAFALAVSLAEQGLFECQEFQRELIASVGEAERGDPQQPTRGYYESWLMSLERLLERKQLLES
jgi:nitrile hydratase accessory protein